MKEGGEDLQHTKQNKTQTKLWRIQARTKQDQVWPEQPVRCGERLCCNMSQLYTREWFLPAIASCDWRRYCNEWLIMINYYKFPIIRWIIIINFAKTRPGFAGTWHLCACVITELNPTIKRVCELWLNATYIRLVHCEYCNVSGAVGKYLRIIKIG